MSKQILHCNFYADTLKEYPLHTYAISGSYVELAHDIRDTFHR